MLVHVMANARRCPICRREAAADSEYRPFCSRRCKDVDLGRWLNEEYRISRPMTAGEMEHALAEERAGLGREEANGAREDEEAS